MNISYDEHFTLVPVGCIRKEQGKTYVDFLESCIPALKELEHFSHAILLWWGQIGSSASFPALPPSTALPLPGVFASRISSHPNPLHILTARLLRVDREQGILEIGTCDLAERTEIVDIKAHFPTEDRVKKCKVPAWMSQWEKWIPENGDKSSVSPVLVPVPEKEEKNGVMSIFPIGVVAKRAGGSSYISLDERWIPALRELEQFSHIRVLWWFHRFQSDRFRRTTQCRPPYEHAPKTGVFASRSPVRPNPIGLTTVKILSIVPNEGLIEVSGLEAFDNTPVLDMTPYIPCFDRVKEFSIPEWVAHWSEWRPEKDEIEFVRSDKLRPADSDRLAALQIQKSHFDRLPETAAISQNNTETLSSDHQHIVIRGARQHNLQNIDVTIPHNELTVVTGVSGSGKSSLAFDTIYAEGQRRYMESFSTQARQVLDQMDKPDVDQMTGLHPTIAIEQTSLSRNPRSTVGTITEISDFLRLLFSRIGTRHCPQCGRAVKPHTAEQVTEQLLNLLPGSRFFVNGCGAFVIPDREDNLNDKFHKLMLEAVDMAFQQGNGTLTVIVDSGEEFRFSKHNACPYCQTIFFELFASLFSFNNPDGACPDCNGLGVRLRVDPERIVTQPHLSLLDGASPWWGKLRQSKRTGNWMRAEVLALAESWKIDLEQTWNDLPQTFRDAVLYGAGEETFRFTYEMGKSGRSGEIVRRVEGAVHHISRLFNQAQGKGSLQTYLKFMSEQPCPTCEGERLCPEARFVTVGGIRFPDVATMSIAQLAEWLETLPKKLDPEQQRIVTEILKELRVRVQSMQKLELHYLTLDRTAPTLSGGEGQRIRLATQLGCSLTGLLYILDEPSIGLHPRDHRALLDTMRQLRDSGNTVLVVEHDADTMRAADWLLDLGPGAGVLGGNVIAAGSPEEVMADPNSLTGQYLSGALTISAPNGAERRKADRWLKLGGAHLHNLRGDEARFPLGLLTCVTGVSGSGKSSLVSQTLSPALSQALHRAENVPGPYERIEGLEQLDKVITITQTPIGRTPRSNPATYVEVFDEIRKLFAKTPQAKSLGYKANRFSFNSKDGRCRACEGLGRRKVEMHFLPDVWVTCSECQGKRFNRETLEITYSKKSIADVLDMDVFEALTFFDEHAKIFRILQTLYDVGLEYIKLGQSALTLSGGEAQRVKLAKELSRFDTGRTVYILDEPTTGLHFADIQKLLDVLHHLTDAGNTVIIIEHNLDVIKTADWIIDLGPEGGQEGGYIVAQGRPEDVAQTEESYTGQFLRQVLGSSSQCTI